MTVYGPCAASSLVMRDVALSSGSSPSARGTQGYVLSAPDISSDGPLQASPRSLPPLRSSPARSPAEVPLHGGSNVYPGFRGLLRTDAIAAGIAADKEQPANRRSVTTPVTAPLSTKIFSTRAWRATRRRSRRRSLRQP